MTIFHAKNRDCQFFLFLKKVFRWSGGDHASIYLSDKEGDDTFLNQAPIVMASASTKATMIENTSTVDPTSPTSETKNDPSVKGPRKPALSGAAKKRFKWLLRNGHVMKPRHVNWHVSPSIAETITIHKDALPTLYQN